MEEQQISPAPQKNSKPLSFPDAISEVVNGKRITRLDWDNKNTYGMLQDGFLMIYVNGEIHKWIVSDGDMLAVDWVILPEGN